MRLLLVLVAVAGLLTGSSAAAPASAARPVRFDERLFALEQAHAMVGNCAHLDETSAAKSARLAADGRYRHAVRQARKHGRAGAVQRARQNWVNKRSSMDTSCIVGPEETPQAAYAALITDFDKATGAVQSALAIQRKGGRGR